MQLRDSKGRFTKAPTPARRHEPVFFPPHPRVPTEPACFVETPEDNSDLNFVLGLVVVITLAALHFGGVL